MSLRCRLGFHRFEGPHEMVRDDSIAQGSGLVTVIAAGYYRYWCLRCGIANDAERTSALGKDA